MENFTPWLSFHTYTDNFTPSLQFLTFDSKEEEGEVKVWKHYKIVISHLCWKLYTLTVNLPLLLIIKHQFWLFHTLTHFTLILTISHLHCNFSPLIPKKKRKLVRCENTINGYFTPLMTVSHIVRQFHTLADN